MSIEYSSYAEEPRRWQREEAARLQRIRDERDEFERVLRRIARRRPSQAAAAAAFFRSREDAREVLRRRP